MRLDLDTAALFPAATELVQVSGSVNENKVRRLTHVEQDAGFVHRIVR